MYWFQCECNISLKCFKYIQQINLVSLPLLNIGLPSGYYNHFPGVILEKFYYFLKIFNFRYECILIKILVRIFGQLISSNVNPKKKKKFYDQQRPNSMWGIFPFFKRGKLYKAIIVQERLQSLIFANHSPATVYMRTK